MGFKIRLANGSVYKNKAGRVQYYETAADARAKIKRRHLKGARVVHVTKTSRVPNKKPKVRKGKGSKGRKSTGKKGKKGRKKGRKKAKITAPAYEVPWTYRF